MSAFIKAGVIGHPVAHSKSPLIHNHWIAQHGLSGSYETIDIAPNDLAGEVARLAESGYAGFNVTIPHKQAIMELCQDLDETARAIGAVNTVEIRNGRLRGYNTDAFGFLENLQRSVFGLDILHRPAIVLGAGGAARAIIYALREAGAQRIIVTNRTVDKARELTALGDQIEVASWETRSDILSGAGLLVNTTSLGMTGKEMLEIDLSALPVDAAVSDIVYAPLMTDLLRQASQRGHQVVTGIGMLLHQARPAFEKWFGVLPEVSEELEKKVLA